VAPLFGFLRIMMTETTESQSFDPSRAEMTTRSKMPKVNRDGELECDFEKNPTAIYLLIQQQDWDGVEYQAPNFPEEVRTFVYRRNPDGVLKWRLLPIHCAILHDAPFSALDALMKAYRASAQAQDDHGMLPIHLAIKKHMSPEVINLLLAAYPKCIDIANYNGLTPYEMADNSSSAHRGYYRRALKRGSPTYAAVTASFSDLLCGVSLPEWNADPSTAFGLMAK
jgi:hypothetical protein